MGPWFCELCDYIALDITDSLVPFEPEPSSCSIIPGEFFCSALLCSALNASKPLNGYRTQMYKTLQERAPCN